MMEPRKKPSYSIFALPQYSTLSALYSPVGQLKLPSLHIATVSEDEVARVQSQAKEAGVEEDEAAVGWQI